MAIFHLNAKVISRGKGQSAIAAAAYRSGDRLKDRAADEVKHYRARAERIQFTGLFVPGNAPEWAKDRESLWNAVEERETHGQGVKPEKAQLAREIEISLPHELTDQQREWLVKDFAREQFVRRGYGVDVAIHVPDGDSDARNHHAHLMITMRTLGPDGFAPTKDRSMNSKAQLAEWREEWAELANRHLARHGHEARIDHRSLEAQGIDREPTIHVGPAGQAMDERGAAMESQTVEVAKTHLPAQTREVRYIEIDQGSRADHNRQIILRNEAREQEQEAARLAEIVGPTSSASIFERLRARLDMPPAAPEIEQEKDQRAAQPSGMDWTDRAGMAAQQGAALEELQRRQREQERETAPQPEVTTTMPEPSVFERLRARMGTFSVSPEAEREKVEDGRATTPAPLDQQPEMAAEHMQRQQREQQEAAREASSEPSADVGKGETTDAKLASQGSDKAREKADRVRELAQWMTERGAGRGEREQDGGREL